VENLSNERRREKRSAFSLMLVKPIEENYGVLSLYIFDYDDEMIVIVVERIRCISKSLYIRLDVIN